MKEKIRRVKGKGKLILGQVVKVAGGLRFSDFKIIGT